MSSSEHALPSPLTDVDVSITNTTSARVSKHGVDVAVVVGVVVVVGDVVVVAVVVVVGVVDVGVEVSVVVGDVVVVGVEVTVVVGVDVSQSSVVLKMLFTI